MKKEIWVLCLPEHRHLWAGVLGKARELSNSESEMDAVAVVPKDTHLLEMLPDFTSLGAQIIEILPGAGSECLLAGLLADSIRKKKPEIVLFPAAVRESSIAAQTAAKLRTGLTAECIALNMGTDGLLHQIRPAFGGGMIAEILCRTKRPQMATVQPSVFLEKRFEVQGDYCSVRENHLGNTKDPVTKLYSTPYLEAEALQSAHIIVAGGRGIKTREGFHLLNRLALALGGCIGASRAAVDSGISDWKSQIGQTGASVHPDIYLAFGISGAVQHVAGIIRSKKIIAVNHDPKAPIFDYADLAVVADWKETVLNLLAYIAERKKD